MSLLHVLALAVSLALDAFAVSVAAGLASPDAAPSRWLRLAAAFGGFQALMPLLGWAGGLAFRSALEAVDHWVAFGLLAFVGGRMILDGLKGGKREFSRSDPTRGWLLLALAVATSIDALAVGLTFSVLRVGILLPALVIGLTAALFTVAGYLLGRRFSWLKGVDRVAGVLGGLVLLAIGVQVLHEHGVFEELVESSPAMVPHESLPTGGLGT